MTLPRERSQALKSTRAFLRSLLDPRETPRVPLSVRVEARWCLRHFPSDLDIEIAEEKCPEIFGGQDG